MSQTFLLCGEGEEFVRHDIIQTTDRLPVFSVHSTVCNAEVKQIIRLVRRD